MIPHSFWSSALAAAALFHNRVLGAAILNRQPSSSAASPSYSLIADYSGQDFFTHFDTFVSTPSFRDPTDGSVNYVDMQDAAQQSLLGHVLDNNTQTQHAYIGVDFTTSGMANRNSVRLEGKDTLQPGTLVVLNVYHVPVADGTWPAVWFLGDVAPNGVWPANGGESDWLEWVHASDINGISANSMTLHTAPGCTVTNFSPSSSGLGALGSAVSNLAGSVQSVVQQGTLQNTNCNAGGDWPATLGCSIAAAESTIFQPVSSSKKRRSAGMPTSGKEFNDMQGGVYVHWWDAEGVTVWLFPRSFDIPADLANGKPNPSSWKQAPLAKFSAGVGGCDFTKSLEAMKPIINIDFCGSWAGQTWASSGAQSRSGGVATCEEYVKDHPEAFKEAYFEIESLKIYGTGADRLGLAGLTSGTIQQNAAAITFPAIDISHRA